MPGPSHAGTGHPRAGTAGVRELAACGRLVGVAVFAVLTLLGPLLLLATTVVGLWTHGPLGWGASVLLVAAVVWTCRCSASAALRWWRSTKAPQRPQVRPSHARR